MSAPKTRIWLPISGSEAGVSMSFELADDFDTVCNRIHPIEVPSSRLGDRANFTHNLAEGGRIMVPPQLVQVVEELEVE